MYGDYPHLGCVARVLVVRMRHHGDVLLTSPLLTQLHKALPNALIDVLLNQETLPMLEGHPAVAQYLLYDRKGLATLSWWRRWIYEWKLFRRIRANRYDLIINLTEGDRGALIARLSGAACRVGFATGKKSKDKCYTHLVKTCPLPRHTVERQLDVLRRMGLWIEDADKQLFFHIPQEALARVGCLLAENGKEPGSYVVIHPVSRWRFKCLSSKQIAAVIVQLHSRGEHVILSGSNDPAELILIEEILRLSPASTLSFAGKLQLKELAALIQLSKGIISVDSAPVHIASALKTPLVALFGPTSEKNWGPWQHPRAQVVTQPFSCRPCLQDGCGGSKRSDCLLSLSPDTIVKAWETVL